MSSRASPLGGNRMGPRPRPFSPHAKDAVLCLTRSPSPAAVWIGDFGILFSGQVSIAAYYPARNVVVIRPNVLSGQLRHATAWAIELSAEISRVTAEEFDSNVLAQLAAAADAVDRRYFPHPDIVPDNIAHKEL